MRKFIATIALLITLIGTFAPVVFSVNGLQKNIANAGTLANTFFGRGITVENIAGDTTSFNMSSSVRYNVAGYSQGGTLGLSAVALHYKVVKLNDQSVVVDGEFDETDYFKNNVEKAFTQKIAMPPDGTYLGWFYEDILLQTENVDSSKVKFVVSGGKITSQSIDASVLNQDSGVKVSFSIPQGFVDPTKPTEIKITGAVFYKDASQPVPSTEDAPVNISWVLTDTNGTEISRKKITGVSGKINEQQGIGYSFIINNLTQGTAYKVHLEENEIKTNGDTVIPSASIPFIAGVEIDNAAIQQQIQQQNADNALADLKNSFGKDGTDGKDGLDCSLWDMDFFCYLVKFTVYITTFVPNIIATVTGLLSDFFLKFAMDPKMYGLSYTEGLGSMIYGAWSIVRDFANIGFIFALFTAAFMLILNKNEINNVQFEPKKVVVRVVIMALLVNFSLMFCRLIIQSADVFSHILYNKIVVTVKGDTAISNFLTKAEVKSVSFGLVTNTNPQQLFMNQGVDKDDPGSYTAYLAIGFITFFIYLIYIYLFVSMTLIWMGRIFGAWIAMILSPIAFVSWAIPFIENDKHIGFTNWLENFVKLAFLVPIYLFFVYISVTVLNLQNLTNGINDPDAGWMFSVIVIIIKVLLPLLAATFILMKGKTIAYDMSGEIGKVAGKFTGMATSLALGAATGGSALLARQTLGRAGSALANANRGNNGLLGKGMRTMGDKLGAASFDVRKNEQAMKRFGQFTSAAGDKIDLGTKGLREGGFVAEGTISEQYRKKQEEIAKNKEEEQKKAAEKALLDAQAKDAKELRENQSKLEMARKAKEAEEAKIAMEAENQGPGTFIEKKEQEKATKEAELQDLKDQKNILDGATVQLQIEKATIESEKTDLVSEQPNLENELTRLEGHKQGVEALLADLASKPDTPENKSEKDKLTKELDQTKKDIGAQKLAIQNNKKEIDIRNETLKNKDKEIEKNQKDLEKKEEEVTKKQEDVDKAGSYATNLAGITSVRDARQKKKDLELEAEHSQSKAKADKMKTEMDEKKTKADEAQKELNALKTKWRNEKPDSPKRAQIEADIAEKEKDRDKKDDEFKKAKDEHKKALRTFNDEFGNKIKAMEDFEKEAIKTYEQDHEVQIRKATMQNAVIAAQKAVNQSQNNLDNINYQHQQQFANDLEKAAQTNQQIAGSFAEHVGTITGGRIMGGSVGRSNDFAAGGVRRNASSRY